MRRLLSLILPLLLSVACANPAPSERATYTNPVLDADFPDPAVLQAPDGWWYAYATQGGPEGAMSNIQAARSRDLVEWERLPDVLPVKPTWAAQTQDFWAPHVHAAGGRYYLYYSAKPDAALTDKERGLCLAVAVAERPQGPFTDIGRPLQCGPSFVNIDPMAYDDPATGKRLLYWGSGFGPIKVQELAADRISFAPGSAPVDLVHPVKSEDPDEYRRLVEGAWVTRRDGWYYLFYSGDNCCGPKAHYAALVARSRSATGPFEAPPERIVVERGGIWVAPGHNSVAQDRRGDHWLLYHAVDARRPRSKPDAEINTRRVMLLDRIVWKDGWPVLAAGGPSEAPQPRPAARPRR
jgi:arabinan endo-1,5-alpha-L-arabinosidase